jgi:probable HAF family extracellular repeat protein
VVGYSQFLTNAPPTFRENFATEWSHGKVIDLGGLPGSTDSIAQSINNAGDVVGVSTFANGTSVATEWSGGKIINLGGLPGFTFSQAESINDPGQVVGSSNGSTIPESSTWAMMLLGFAGLAFAGYRRTSAGHATVARSIC